MTYGAFHSIAPLSADDDTCGFTPAPYGVESDHVVVGEGAVMFAVPGDGMAPPPIEVTEETTRLIEDESKAPYNNAALGWATAPRAIELLPIASPAPKAPLARIHPVPPVAAAMPDISAMAEASAFRRSEIVAKTDEPPRSLQLDPTAPDMPPVDLTVRPSETDLRWVPPTRKQVAIRTLVTQGPLYLVLCFISYGLYLAYTEYKDDVLAELDPTLIAAVTADAGPIATDERSSRASRPLIVIPESTPKTESAEQLATPERLIAPEAAAEIETANAGATADSMPNIAIAEILPDTPASREAAKTQTAALSAGVTPEPGAGTAPADNIPVTDADVAGLAEAEVIAKPEPQSGPLAPDAPPLTALSANADPAAAADEVEEERSVVYDDPKLRVSPLPLPRPGTDLAEAPTGAAADAPTETLVELGEDAPLSDEKAVPADAATETVAAETPLPTTPENSAKPVEEIADTTAAISVERGGDIPPPAVIEVPTDIAAGTIAVVDAAETAAPASSENPAKSVETSGNDEASEPKTVAAKTERLRAIPASVTTAGTIGTDSTKPELALDGLDSGQLNASAPTPRREEALAETGEALDGGIAPIEMAALDTGTPEAALPDEEVVFSPHSPRAAPSPVNRP